MRFTLSAPGLEDLVMGDDQYCSVDVDLGHPIPRVESEPNPDADGDNDTTALEGGRVITATIEIGPAWTWAMTQRLKAFTHPRLRPTLLIEQEDAPALIAQTRMSPFSDQFDAGKWIGRWREPTLQWIVPSGILESAELHQEEVAGSDPGALGVAFDWSFDLTFPASQPEGEVEVTNFGDRDVYPLIQLYGPWSGSTRVANATTDQALVFAGENVLAGNYIEIDTRAKTITLNGDPTQNRYNRLVFPDSDWWKLAPGANVLRFEPTTFTAPARMIVAWRDAYS